jgi:hypothetical protein
MDNLALALVRFRIKSGMTVWVLGIPVAAVLKRPPAWFRGSFGTPATNEYVGWHSQTPFGSDKYLTPNKFGVATRYESQEDELPTYVFHSPHRPWIPDRVRNDKRRSVIPAEAGILREL